MAAVRSLLPALLVGLLLVCPSCTGVHDVLTTRFDVEAADSAGYSAFLAAFHKNVNATTKATSGKWIDKHPVLGNQQLSNQPAFWLNVLVKDTKGANTVTLAIRSDNLYLWGFQNHYGEWFTFDRYQKTFPHPSTPLHYGSSYPDLFGKRVGYKGMDQIRENKTCALQHLRTLASYRAGAGPDPDGALKVPLAFYILVVSEAERFEPIKAAVSAAWAAPTPTRNVVPAEDIRLLVQWARISCALRAWDKYGRSAHTWSENTEANEIRKVQINSPAQALSIINVLLTGKKCSMKH